MRKLADLRGSYRAYVKPQHRTEYLKEPDHLLNLGGKMKLNEEKSDAKCVGAFY